MHALQSPIVGSLQGIATGPPAWITERGLHTAAAAAAAAAAARRTEY